jgi:hypothetical protein
MPIDKKIVIIPTYNERENIEKMIRKSARWRETFISSLLTMVPRTERQT